jgi:hypothetical protein
MNEEEKKATNYYKNNEYSFGFEIDMDMENFKKALGIEETDEDTWEKHQMRFKTLVNLIEKQQKELDKKDKMIGFMATAIDNYDSQLEICKFKNRGHVIEYFTNLVEKENI